MPDLEALETELAAATAAGRPAVRLDAIRAEIAKARRKPAVESAAVAPATAASN